MTVKKTRIGETPLSISVYTVEKAPTLIHDKGTLEIIFCLKGSVKFSYAYEEFTLKAGEFISVDKDAYYLYEGRDNLLVSFYFDLMRYVDKHPYICNCLFVCEGLAEATMRYPTREHRKLKGMLIALLKYLCDVKSTEKNMSAENSEIARRIISGVAERIIDLFVTRFDVFFFHTGYDDKSEEMIDKLHQINGYIQEHMREKVTIGDLAKQLNFTESYMSEYLRRISVGFRSMLNYVRSNASEHLLLKTDKTILEISEECGFSDVKYYYSAFKKWYKCTPGQFRRRYGQAGEYEGITYLDIESTEDILEELLVEHYLKMFLTEDE